MALVAVGGGGANTDRYVIHHPGKIGSTGSNPAVSSTYFMIPGNFFPAAIAGSNPNVRNPIAVACTLTSMYVHARIGTSATAGFNVTHCIRKNDTTDSSPLVTLEYFTTASATIPATGNATGISLSFAAGDDFSQKVVTPAWTPTLPQGVLVDAALLFNLV